MFGCLRTVGCLTLVAALGVGGWVTRDRWLPAITGERPATVGDYDRVSTERRERAQKVIADYDMFSAQSRALQLRFNIALFVGSLLLVGIMSF